jgi:hypothetical protein
MIKAQEEKLKAIKAHLDSALELQKLESGQTVKSNAPQNIEGTNFPISSPKTSEKDENLRPDPEPRKRLLSEVDYAPSKLQRVCTIVHSYRVCLDFPNSS